jgi:hypothetical protein
LSDRRRIAALNERTKEDGNSRPATRSRSGIRGEGAMLPKADYVKGGTPGHRELTGSEAGGEVKVRRKRSL